MDRSLRWKTITLGLLVVLSVLYLLPSTGAAMPTWFSGLFSKKVQLGLDLQGGLHIVYGVDLDKAVDDKAGEIKRDMESKLGDQGVKAKVITPRDVTGGVYVILDDAADKSKIDSRFLDEYKEFIGKSTINCPDDIKDKAVCVRVTSDYADRIKDSALSQAIKTIKDRVDRYGIAEATVIKKGDSIIVEFPGQDDERIKRLKGIINRTAQLEFKMVVATSEDQAGYMAKVMTKVGADAAATQLGIKAQNDVWEHEEKGRFASGYLTATDDPDQWVSAADAKTFDCLSNEAQGEGDTAQYKCKITGQKKLEAYLGCVTGNDPKSPACVALGVLLKNPDLAKPDTTLNLPDDREFGYEEVQPRDTAKIKKNDLKNWRTYFLEHTAGLTGTAISAADVTWNPTSNRPEVLVTFNRYGTRQFGDLTSKHVGDKMAIILDDRVTSAPVIQSAITGGRSTITMGGSDPQVVQREAQDLVNVLRTGALPAPLSPQSESQVGALLGQDAISRAQLSMAVGAVLVVILMLFFYKASGMIANLAMIMNVLFQVAILVGMQATLTLPGIAGLVLTIGMAVDSNIIIYERIREELRSGKSVRGAVDAGFNRAFWTVFDAHVTNFVAGFVLLEYGTGPIRGFAVMLLIGVVCNLFTSTWVSRLMFDHYIGRRKNMTALSI
jgi:preprotein translocase subunit SecD